jgi:hypothetical protein
MRSAVGFVIVAIVVAVLGRAAVAAGTLEQRTAEAQASFLTLRYGALGPDLEALEADAGSVPLPWLTSAMRRVIRGEDAQTRYWLGQYGTLGAARDAAGVLTETDPELLRLAAHAQYRAAQGTPDGARRLEDVAKAYGEVLRANPGDENAAWNYEFVVRLRGVLAQAKGAVPLPPGPDRVLAGDLPAGNTIHGQAGAPPAGTDMQKFKMVIPLRSDERNQLPQSAGQAEPRKRRG